MRRFASGQSDFALQAGSTDFPEDAFHAYVDVYVETGPNQGLRNSFTVAAEDNDLPADVWEAVQLGLSVMNTGDCTHCPLSSNSQCYLPYYGNDGVCFSSQWFTCDVVSAGVVIDCGPVSENSLFAQHSVQCDADRGWVPAIAWRVSRATRDSLGNMTIDIDIDNRSTKLFPIKPAFEEFARFFDFPFGQDACKGFTVDSTANAKPNSRAIYRVVAHCPSPPEELNIALPLEPAQMFGLPQPPRTRITLVQQ